MKRSEILKSIGFRNVNKNDLISYLNNKGTKSAKSVAERIENSKHYEVYKKENIFTINSEFLATTNEQKIIGRFLKSEYQKPSVIMDSAGKWFDWTKAENGFNESTEMSKESYNDFLNRNNTYRIMNRR